MDSVKAMLDTIIELSVKVARAEDLAEAYRVNMEKERSDKEYWKKECFKLSERLEKLKGETDAEV